MNKCEFGLKLAKLRYQGGYTARELSLFLGFNPSYINNIETGDSYPSMEKFFLICSALGIRPIDFFACDLDANNQNERTDLEFNNQPDFNLTIK